MLNTGCTPRQQKSARYNLFDEKDLHISSTQKPQNANKKVGNERVNIYIPSKILTYFRLCT